MATFRFKRLTLRQREVFDFIEKFIAEAVYPPTIREIGKAFGFSEKAAFDYVAVLVRKGMLERRADDTPRNIKLTPFSQLFSWKAQADIQHLGVQKGDVLTVSPAASPVVGDRVLTTHGHYHRISRRAADSRQGCRAIASIGCGSRQTMREGTPEALEAIQAFTVMRRNQSVLALSSSFRNKI